MKNEKRLLWHGAVVVYLIGLLFAMRAVALAQPEPVEPVISAAAASKTAQPDPASPVIVVNGNSVFLPIVVGANILSPFEQDVVNLVNVERAAVGCDPLIVNAKLTAAARLHNADMANNRFFSHTGSDGSSPGDRIDRQGYDWSGWAENIAAGYSTPEDVMDGWMNSQGHRANILDCNLTEIGVGHLLQEGTQYGHYWTQVFGRPR